MLSYDIYDGSIIFSKKKKKKKLKIIK